MKPQVVAGFNETREREAREVKASVLSVLATAGLPKAWTATLVAVAPIAADAAAQVVKALHPDSPGGVRLLKSELRAIAKREAARLESALLGAFVDLVVDDEKPTRTRKVAEITDSKITGDDAA